MRKLIHLAALIAIMGQSALANDVLLMKQNETLDPQQAAAILDRHQGSGPRLKFRSIRLTADVPEAEASGPSALALPVQFAFDSAEIMPQAEPQLDALAQGIKLLSPATVVVIEGHTDAHGTERYNFKLSAKRAIAVKDYLVFRHGIDGARLKTLAKGEDDPFNRENPYADENRRVQFHGE
jgi:outer membrane protein OmpA-like peptidoglycan-associated protein